MILYYIRHGDPIYNPNQLTPLGERQAEAVAKRLSVHGVDKIFTSPSNRARQTAQPLCEITKQEPTILDWTDEDLLYDECLLFEIPELNKKFFREGPTFNTIITRSAHQIGRAHV